MYEEHFGLKSNPFRSNAKGEGVYVGPSQDKIMSRIHKGLSAADNIVTVSGPAGIGKTAIVTRALETNRQNQLVAWIGRMRLAPDEVMQLLLAGFGITRQVPGTVRQFAVFQRLLSEKAAADTRVVIVIEDALRIGDETLLELEAITATDTGNVGGANLILMGPPELDIRLNSPELARLRQRSRLGQKIAALNSNDVSAYLEHLVRGAGRQCNELFEDDVAPMLYQLSAGVPRVINNICDAALAETEEQNLSAVSRQLVLDVAADVYGLEPAEDAPPSIAVPESPIAPKEKLVDLEPTNIQAEAEIQVESAPQPEPVVPIESVAESVSSTPDLPPVVAASLAQELEEFSTQADLINVTGEHPALESEDFPYVPPVVDEADEQEEYSEPEAFNDTADDLPMLSNSMRIDGPITPAPIDEVNEQAASPAAVRTSPVPDLDALEAAITAARGGDAQLDETDTFLPDLNFKQSAPADEAVVTPEAKPQPESETELEQKPWPAPEINLDTVPASGPVPDPFVESEPLPQAEASPEPVPVPEPELEPELEPLPEPEPVFDSAPEPEPVFDSEPEPLPEPVFEEAPAPAAEKIAEITLDESMDKSLEDQRLEGNKLDELASELGSADSLEDMSDMMAETLFGIEFEQIAKEALKNPPAAGTLPGDTDVLATDAFASPDNSASANDPGEEPSPVMLEADEPEKTPTVSAPIIQTLPEADEPMPQLSAPDAEPESIENQFQTEITQTMKTIDPANLPNAEPDDDDGNKPGGLFGRLKKSFRG